MTTAVRKDPAERMNSMVDIDSVDEAVLTSTTNNKLAVAAMTKATDVAHEARRGMLQSLIMPGMATKFSSRPIQVSDENETKTESSKSGAIVPATNPNSATENVVSNNSNKGPYLTASEKKYLESLLQSNDPDAIRRASDRLSDASLFPRSESDETVSSSSSKNVDNSTGTQKQHSKLQHRDSELQRSLFRFHEEAKVRPSTLLKRLSQHRTSSGGLRTASPVDFDSSEKKTEDVLLSTENSWDMDEEKKSNEEEEDPAHEGEKTITDAEWDDLMNAAAWITAESGDSIEVNDEGSPMLAHSNATSAFQVLGTSAQDTSCFPHVLSPPIMEGLLAFVPESLTENSNFWLKYSLVRDGPGLLNMLRHVRASNHTVLAIETTGGHVFGAFASRPWRLSNGYFGSSDSFLFRMRHSRNKHCTTVVERALLETELEFFPYTNMNNSVQRCTRDGVSIGSTELSNTGCDHQEGGENNSHDHDGGEYFGSALSLDKTLLSGTTSSSETFGNPCLTHSNKRGCEFEVANVEVWTLTPHDTVGEAENEEMEALFFEETYSRDNKKLDLLGILVGTPYGQVHT